MQIFKLQTKKITFPSLPSQQQEERQKSPNSQKSPKALNYRQKKSLQQLGFKKSLQQLGYKKSGFKNSQTLQKSSTPLRRNMNQLQTVLQDLDIQPIQHIQNIAQQNVLSSELTNPYTSKQTQKQNEYSQSQCWSHVFYAQRTIVSLFKERNDVCLHYALNSQNLRKHTQNSANKRIFKDEDIVNYVTEVFQESPSYSQYNSMSFTIIPQPNSLIQKYYIFFGTDGKFVPLCKNCNISIYLILTVKSKIKNTRKQIQQKGIKNQQKGTKNQQKGKRNQQKGTKNQQKGKKHIILNGRLFCSNLKCKLKVLGEIAIDHIDDSQQSKHQQKANKQNIFIKSKRQQTITEQSRLSSQMRQKLTQKDKLKIKKASMKIAF